MKKILKMYSNAEADVKLVPSRDIAQLAMPSDQQLTTGRMVITAPCNTSTCTTGHFPSDDSITTPCNNVAAGVLELPPSSACIGSSCIQCQGLHQAAGPLVTLTQLALCRHGNSITVNSQASQHHCMQHEEPRDSRSRSCFSNITVRQDILIVTQPHLVSMWSMRSMSNKRATMHCTAAWLGRA